jgi:hypothetical protein
MSLNPLEFTAETKVAAKPIMLAVFYLMFDTVSSTDEAVVRCIDIPRSEVGEFLVVVLAAMGIRARVMYLEGRLKLDMHAGCITTTQTKIMQYFAYQVNKLNEKQEVTFRLPGADWRPPAGKSESAMTPGELMFARTYGALIPANRIERVLDEAETYNYDTQPLTE